MKRLIPLAIVALAFACSTPEAETEPQCGPNQPCGPGLQCDLKSGTCQSTGNTQPADAAPDPIVVVDARAGADAALGAARLTVTPAELIFGTVVIGQTGMATSIKVENAGTAPSSLLDVNMTGARASAFVVDPLSSCIGARLAPGESCMITVAFRPDAAGPLAAMLDVGGMDVPLTGTGVRQGQLELSPTGADLGAVEVGARGEPVMFTLSNKGDSPSGPVAIDLDGAGADDVEISVDNCSGKPLAAMGSCTIFVLLHPKAPGVVAASLTATATPGGAEAAMLTGRGLTAADLVVTPTALDLGTIVVGSAGTATITVTNEGGVPSAALETSVVGGVTVIADECDGAPLDAGASCTITVEAHPAAAGTTMATVTVTAGDTAVPVPVVAQAVPPGALTLSPDKQEYAAALLGVAGETHTFTVRNTGGAPTGTLDTTLSGTGRGQFRIVTDECDGKILGADARCAVTVRFQPDARHTQSANLGVSASPGGAASSSLSGVGLAQAALSSDADMLAFGTVDVSLAGVPQSFNLTNLGDVPTGVLSTTISGDVADFVIVDGCRGAPLAAAGFCPITVTFAPLSGGMKSLELAVEGAPGGSLSLVAGGDARPPSPLTVAHIGNGSGAVGSEPAGITCGATCAATYVHGTVVTLTATPDEGSMFDGWTGACSTTPCILDMTAARAVVATFTLLRIGLDVSVEGQGGVTCDGGACAPDYDWGTEVTLEATPATGHGFSGWTGCPSPDGETCTVTLKSATEVTAQFAPLPIPVTVNVTGNGSVATTGFSCGASCTQSFPFGIPVTLTATPAANHHIVAWSGACAAAGSTASCTFTPGVSPVTLGISFTIDTHTLTISTPGGGTLSTTPASVDCTTSCDVTFDHAQVVTVKATPSAGYRFNAFAGDCTGTGACSVTIDKARSVSATFVRQYVLTVTPPTGGTISGSGINCGTAGAACSVTLDTGTPISLTATADNGYRLGTWTGCTTASGGSCSLTLDAAKTVAHGFVRTRVLTVTKPTGGTITGTGTINCGTGGNVCSATLDDNTPVSLTAAPDAGYRLGTWSGCTTASGGSCSLTITGAPTVAHGFVRQHVLTVTRPTGGTITGNGINCGTSTATCTATLDENTPIALTAAADAGYRLGTWTGCTTASGGSCSLTLTSSPTIAHGFVRQYVLTVTRPTGGTITGTGNINCGTSPTATACSATLDANAAVSLTATPDSGYRYGTWSGCTPNGATCTLTMTSSPTVANAFVRQRILTVTRPTGGTITGNGINCGTSLTTNPCEVTIDEGTAVALTAAADSGYRVGTWSPSCTTASGASCGLTLNAAATVSHTFVKTYLLTVSQQTGGKVTGPGGIDCGTSTSACTATFDAGTSVTLTGTADPGYRLNAWTGCTPVPGGTCTLTMNSSPTVTLTYIRTYTLTVTRPTAGTITGNGINCGTNVNTTPCQVTLDAATPVALSAVADNGYRVGTWTGCTTVSGASCGLTLNANTTVGLSFIQQYTLSWSTGNGGGTLSPSPAGIACATANCRIYDAGTDVTLNTSPDQGSSIGSWGGACMAKPAGSTSCTVKVNANKSASVTYRVTLSVSISGSGSVATSTWSCGTSCSQTYDYGASVDLGASPSNNQRFDGWGGSCSSTGGCNVVMNGPKSVSASFSQIYHNLRVQVNAPGGVIDYAGNLCSGTCDYTVAQGASVLLSLNSLNQYWSFDGWSPTNSFTMTGATTVTAYFFRQLGSTGIGWGGKMTLSGTWRGAAVSYVCNGTAGECPGAASSWKFDYDSTISVSATPDSGLIIQSWDGMAGGAVPIFRTSFSILNFGTVNQTVFYVSPCGTRICPVSTPRVYPEFRTVGVTFQWIVG